MLTAIAEIFCNTRGVSCALHTQQRRNIRWRGNHHGTRAAFCTENVLDKVFNFTTTLANQAHDDHVRLRVTCHHAEQDGFTDT
ncbi:hypothetical protein D3C78_1503070 [compost metagenome]